MMVVLCRCDSRSCLLPVAGLMVGAVWLLLAAIGTGQAQLVGHGGMVKGVAVSGDGARVASAGFDYSVMLWDLKAVAAVSLMHGHEAAVNAVAFTPDGLRVVSGGDDGKVLLWRLGQGAPERVMSGHRGRVAGVAVAPDGRSGGFGGLGPDGSVVGSGDWGAGRGTGGACRQCQRGGVYAGWCRVVSAGEDGTVRVWERADGREIEVLGGGLPVNALALTPDGRRVVAGGIDGRVRVWDLEAGAEVLPALEGSDPVPVLGVAVSPDGATVASAGVNGAVVVWALESGRVLHTLAGHRGPVWGLAFTPDGKRLLTAGGDGAIRIWDTATGAEIRTGGAQVAALRTCRRGSAGRSCSGGAGLAIRLRPMAGTGRGRRFMGCSGGGSGPCRDIRIQRR